MSGGAKKTLFLTGGSGVLGDALVRVLADEYDLLCMTRKSAVRRAGVEVIRGDIGEPRLGLSRDEYDALAARIDWIIHLAAITRLDGGEREIERANYAGTQHMLELAEYARKPLYHVSTAFTHPCDYFEGVMPQTPYEAAKVRAERLVRASGLPVSIFRPSIVIGDSDTGHMPRFQGFHMTMGLMMLGALPIVPCPATAYVDVISRDVAARAIKHALDRALIGDSYFLTSGAASLTTAQMLDIVGDATERSGVAFNRPKCMHPDIFERLVRPVFLPMMPAEVQPVLLRASLMCRYGCLRSPMPSSLDALLDAEQLGRRSPALELSRSIAFLRPKLATIARMLKTSVQRSRHNHDDTTEFA